MQVLTVPVVTWMSDFTGLYDTTEESPHWSVGSNASSDGQQMPGDKAQAEAVVLRKDPIMLLNEHCQRNHLKVTRRRANTSHTASH